jgi:phytoene dehydrogenase-like protein
MTKTFDAIIIGAGHNGLVCAAYLAKAGKKVLVFERAGQVGGACITREFAKGFQVSAGAHILGSLQPKIIKDLGLNVDGAPVETVSLSPDGKHVSVANHQPYQDFVTLLEGYAKVLAPEFLKAPPRLIGGDTSNTLRLLGLGKALRLGLGKKGMQDFLRVIGMNIHALVDEHLENEALKAALCFDAILGSGLEPRMPGTVFTYLHRLACGLASRPAVPKGGMGAVTKALADVAEGAGTEIRLDAPVRNILLDQGVASGVVLENGDVIKAPMVVSNADPKTTFLKILGADKLEAGFAHRIANIRAQGRAAKVHIALDGLPTITGLSEKDKGQRLIVAPDRQYIDAAYSPSKYGEVPKRPVMEITIPTLHDPDLAPKGCHVMSIIVQSVPTNPKAGWKKEKETLAKAVVDTLSGFAPDLKDKMTALECLSPEDLEQEFGLPGGHWHHGELALDQAFMMRPTYGAAQYKTPIDGLYLCGAGAHPGGGVTGAPGHNAAQVILKGGK